MSAFSLHYAAMSFALAPQPHFCSASRISLNEMDDIKPQNQNRNCRQCWHEVTFNVQGHSRSRDKKWGATTKANEKIKITLYCCVPLCLWAPKLTTNCSFTCIDKLLFHRYWQTALSHVSFVGQDEGVVSQDWMRWRTTVQSKKRQWERSAAAAKVQASVARWI